MIYLGSDRIPSYLAGRTDGRAGLTLNAAIL